MRINNFFVVTLLLATSRAAQNTIKLGDPECTAQEILADGECEHCKKLYMTPNAAKTECITPQCEDESITIHRKIIMRDGTCSDCHPYKIASDDDRTCIDPVCTGRDWVTKTEGCQPCGDFTIPNIHRSKCVAPKCKANEKQTKEGACVACGDYMTALDTDKKTCIRPFCKEGILHKNGTCAPCDDYTVANAGKTMCVDPECAADVRQKVNVDGTCAACDDFTARSENKQSCAAPPTTPRQVINKDGTLKTCDDYTKPSEDMKSCDAPTCEKNDKFTATGDCESCKFSVVSADKKSCVDPECAADVRQKVNEDGTCAACDDFTARSEDKQSCAAPTTTPRQVINKDGTLKTCDDYTKPVENACTKPTPKANEIILKDGTIKACDEYTAPDKDNMTCVAPKCDGDQSVMKKDGTGCTKCEDFFAGNEENKECIQPTCDEAKEKVDKLGHCTPKFGVAVVGRGMCSKANTYEIEIGSSAEDSNLLEKEECALMVQKQTVDGYCANRDGHFTYGDDDKKDAAGKPIMGCFCCTENDHKSLKYKASDKVLKVYKLQYVPEVKKDTDGLSKYDRDMAAKSGMPIWVEAIILIGAMFVCVACCLGYNKWQNKKRALEEEEQPLNPEGGDRMLFKTTIKSFNKQTRDALV